MAAQVQPLTKPPRTRQTAWSALVSHYKTVSKLHLQQLFADDPKRGERLALKAVGLYLDYSKNRCPCRLRSTLSPMKRSDSFFN
jgi:hypothetical protein